MQPSHGKLESIFTDGERQALLSLPAPVTALKENQDILRGRQPLPLLRDRERLQGHGTGQAFYIAGDIPDWEKLKQAGDFDPPHLHLEQEQAAA